MLPRNGDKQHIQQSDHMEKVPHPKQHLMQDEEIWFILYIMQKVQPAVCRRDGERLTREDEQTVL